MGPCPHGHGHSYPRCHEAGRTWCARPAAVVQDAVAQGIIVRVALRPYEGLTADTAAAREALRTLVNGIFYFLGPEFVPPWYRYEPPAFEISGVPLSWE